MTFPAPTAVVPQPSSFLAGDTQARQLVEAVIVGDVARAQVLMGRYGVTLLVPLAELAAGAIAHAFAPVMPPASPPEPL